MKVDEAWKRIKTSYCKNGVFAYQDHHWEQRSGEVAVFRIDSPQAEASQRKRESEQADRFIGIYDGSVSIEKFREDCEFVTGEAIETDSGAS